MGEKEEGIGHSDAALVEAEVEEPVGEAPAVTDRPLGQTSVLMLMGFIVAAQIPPRLLPASSTLVPPPRSWRVTRRSALPRKLHPSAAAYAICRQNELGGQRGRDGLQIDAVLFDDAAQLDYGPHIEVDRAGGVLGFANDREGWLAGFCLLMTSTKRRASCAQPHFCATAAHAILKNLRVEILQHGEACLWNERVPGRLCRPPGICA
jgi:hypothetical protein